MMQLSIIASNCVLVLIQNMILRVLNSLDLLDTCPAVALRCPRQTIKHNRTPPRSPKVIDDRTWSEREKCHRTPSKMDGHLWTLVMKVVGAV
ncbi:hypothetical protein CDAR_550121 [Caerostris darwini]|uniref:Secreted protein n=1 Tax=Caerostris darwini TaxID=1538125 RepID=A0AAV4PK06_9ARAC|nr:hypothetical protein CDAR_550121 [Caerostris darwini]